MKRLWNYILAQRLVVGAVAAVALIIIGSSLWNSGSGKFKTLTVSRGDFVQQVSVSGKVEAANEVDLGFSQSGRIARIYAKEGDVVGQGALIAEVENGDLYAALLQKQAALDRAKAQLDSLKRGARPEEVAVKEASVASARAAVDAAEQGVVDAVVSAYATADSAIHSTVDVFFSNPNSSSPQVTVQTSNQSLKSSVESRRVQMESVLKTWANANATLTKDSDLARASSDAQAALQLVSLYLADVGSMLSSAVPSSAVSQTTLDTYKTSVATARTNLNTVTSTLTNAVKSQTATQTAELTAERDLALTKAGATQEDVRAQEASVKAAEADVLSASAQLQKTQIRAPFPGTVTKIDAKVGKAAQPSEPQVSVIGSGVFQIETFVPEINVALIQKGNPARVTFDSYGPDATFDASVLTVDLGETIRDGVSTYRTILVFSGTDPRIRSGMTANVVITTITKPDTISIPQKLVVIKNGKPTVKVEENGTSVDRAVSTGAVSSSGMIEIVSGLSVGDLVIEE